MPNVKGGKGYKRGKNSDEAEKMITWDAASGQMLGRVIKVLGSRRFSVYCNDSILRTCRICGSMRKSDWINLGAIVLVGVRAVGTSLTDTNAINGVIQIGDIIHLFGPTMYKDLKAIPTTNPILFTSVEKKMEENVTQVEDDFFLDEGEEEEGETAAELNAQKASEKELADAKQKEKAKEHTIKMKSKRELTLDDL